MDKDNHIKKAWGKNGNANSFKINYKKYARRLRRVMVSG
jgi:hypothetical protein